jgi:hypothetical protein
MPEPLAIRCPDDVLERLKTRMEADNISNKSTAVVAALRQWLGMDEPGDSPSIRAEVQELRVMVEELKASISTTAKPIELSKTKAITTKKVSSPRDTQATDGDGRLEFIKFASDNKLGITRKNSTAEVRKALENAGLDSQYSYNSTVRAFYPVE